jgi:hypothetical protein
MAKQLIALVICSLMLAVAVQAHPGKQAKLQTAGVAHGLQVARMKLVTLPLCSMLSFVFLWDVLWRSAAAQDALAP